MEYWSDGGLEYWSIAIERMAAFDLNVHWMSARGLSAYQFATTGIYFQTSVPVTRPFYR
ncbi:hypothetical protein D1AOALGA4SA_7732 [Olavius algarvensis Delta 1 endosymbiont]|nr:hypothetical protein D1AOALGA4SA_7732 [Olavius algarvensis Delta 1 endosymbiont]